MPHRRQPLGTAGGLKPAAGCRPCDRKPFCLFSMMLWRFSLAREHARRGNDPCLLITSCCKTHLKRSSWKTSFPRMHQCFPLGRMSLMRHGFHRDGSSRTVKGWGLLPGSGFDGMSFQRVPRKSWSVKWTHGSDQGYTFVSCLSSNTQN